MSQYFKPTDIKAKLIEGMDINAYLTEADKAVIDLAECLGILSTNIVEPLHFQLYEYGKNYSLMRICEDKMGTCSPDTLQFDKYFQLTEYYRRRVADVRSRISPEIVTGTVSERRDRAVSTGVLLRG